MALVSRSVYLRSACESTLTFDVAHKHNYKSNANANDKNKDNIDFIN
jgi:hypothetical protein